ncbi:3-oxoacyl-[acyl-carrier protein] reductase [Marinobacterium lacunae]|uniref:3-oxoacyl-[acyl-carrier protein] reductase n=1 Tax=Marinobacterium lacunae TaxID=1232683 RepID=A0A081FU87_9GAMM|nr:SDR family oxidoreductase [Marinobacterium lacunae]KEA62092.1 3-oxoacyl-[acyl-carrier protein] reductase [Marinobacterium lacunae]
MDLNLKGQVVMIAAASKGMGYATALECAREGAIVSMASRDKQAIESAAETIRQQTGATVKAYTFDAGDAQSIKQWAEDTLRDLGPVKGLLVNAGGPPTGQFDSFDDDDWQSAFELTLMSSVRMIRAVLPSMRASGGGSILAITSSSVKEPIDILILSNVMRSGVTSLIKSLSQQLGPDNIRLNTLIPGKIDTDRLRGTNQAQASKRGVSVEEHNAQMAAQLPMRRFGDADEVGKACAFLLSDAASYITGVSLAVDGGLIKTVW